MHETPLPFPPRTGYWVNRLASILRTEVDRRLKGFDLTRSQLAVLMHVQAGLASSAAELTRLLGIDSTAVTRLIDRLETKQILERYPDEDDGRVQRVRLTRQAQELLPALMRAGSEVDALFTAELAPEELHAFQVTLMKMLRSLDGDRFALISDETESLP